GGAGFGRLELAGIAEELGRALAPIPFSSSAYLATQALLLTGSAAPKRGVLPEVASGGCLATFAHADPAGGPSEAVGVTFTGGKLSGTKVPVLDGSIAQYAVVNATSGADVALAWVDLSATGVQRTAVRSIDPSRSLASIRFDGAPAQLLGDRPSGRDT